MQTAVFADGRSRRTLARAALLAGGCGGLFLVVYAVTVRTSYGRVFADASLRGAVRSRARLGDLVDHALGFVTVASLLGALALIAVIALVRLRRGLGLAALGVLVGSNVTAQLLKDFLLDRPDLGLLESAPATLNSLPSGHSTAAFSAVVALLLVVPPRVRRAVAASGAAYAVLVALATMAAGWHRAADSVAAFLVVGAWAGIAVLAVVLAGAAERPPEGDPPAAVGRRWLVSWTALGLAAALALMVLLALVGPVRESSLGLAAAFGAGAVLIGASAVLLVLAVLALLERVAPGSLRATADTPAPDPDLD